MPADFQNTIEISSSGMEAQARRMRHISENIANVDTPGYRSKTVSFQGILIGGLETGRVQVGDVKLSRKELTQIFDPSHPMADDTGYYSGSNVDIIVEVANSRQANRSYEANLQVFEQARQMHSRLLELARR
ncbi:MAG: flagellar basal body rod protein FlgC [Pseudomonadota bacterium]